MKKLLGLFSALCFFSGSFKALATFGVGTSDSNDAIAIMWDGGRGLAPASGAVPSTLTIDGTSGEGLSDGIVVPQGTLIYGSRGGEVSYFFWDGVAWEKLTQSALAAQTVDSIHIRPNAIRPLHIRDTAILSNHIKSDAIDSAHIHDNAIRSIHLKDGAVYSNDLNLDATVVYKKDSLLRVNSDRTFSLSSVVTEFELGLQKQEVSGDSSPDTVRILLSEDVNAALVTDGDTLKIPDLGIKTVKVSNSAVTGIKLAVPDTTTKLYHTNRLKYFVIAVDTTDGDNIMKAISPDDLREGEGKLSVKISASTYQEALEVCWSMNEIEAETKGILPATVKSSSSDTDGSWKLATVQDLTELYHQALPDGGVDWDAARSDFGTRSILADVPANYFTADLPYVSMRDGNGYGGYLGTFCFNDGVYNTNYETGYVQTSGASSLVTPFFVSRYGTILMTNEDFSGVNPFVNPGVFDKDDNGDLISDGVKHSCNRTHFRCVRR